MKIVRKIVRWLKNQAPYLLLALVVVLALAFPQWLLFKGMPPSPEEFLRGLGFESLAEMVSYYQAPPYHLSEAEIELALELRIPPEALSAAYQACAPHGEACSEGMLLSLTALESSNFSNCGQCVAWYEFGKSTLLNVAQERRDLTWLAAQWQAADIRNNPNSYSKQYVPANYEPSQVIGSCGNAAINTGGGALGGVQSLPSSLRRYGVFPYDVWTWEGGMTFGANYLAAAGWRNDLSLLQKIEVGLSWNRDRAWMTKVVLRSILIEERLQEVRQRPSQPQPEEPVTPPQECSLDAPHEIIPSCVTCGNILFCYGNEFRACETNSRLNGQDNVWFDREEFGKTVSYNGLLFDVPTGGVYVCNANVFGCANEACVDKQPDAGYSSPLAKLVWEIIRLIDWIYWGRDIKAEMPEGPYEEENPDLDPVDPSDSWQWPVDSQKLVCDCYCHTSRGPGQAVAIDLSIPNGSAVYPAKSLESTVVRRGCFDWSGYGCYLMLDYGGGWRTLYAHLDSDVLRYNLGDKVSPTDVVSTITDKGWRGGGHLHLEVWYQGRRICPEPIFFP